VAFSIQQTWFDRRGLKPDSIYLTGCAFSPNDTRHSLGADQRADGELRVVSALRVRRRRLPSSCVQRGRRQ